MGAKVGKIIVFLSATVEVIKLQATSYGLQVPFGVVAVRIKRSYS